MNKKLSLILLVLSVLSILSSVSLLAYVAINTGGSLLIVGMIALALGVRGFQAMKGFSYTFWIFTAVISSMFYPQYFIRNILSLLAIFN